MSFTYRLSRRLAQAHLALIGFLVLACGDIHDPSPIHVIDTDSSTPLGPDGGIISQVITSNSTCANQPAGLTLITDNPWNTEPPYSLPGGGSLDWRTYNGSGRVNIRTDASAPRSSSPIIEGIFPKGQQGGGAPFNVGIKFKKVKTLYWCVWQMLDPNFTNNGNTGTKWGFIFTPYGTGSQRLNHYVNLANNLGINLQFYGGTLNRNMRTPYNMVNNGGKWHRIEFLVIANTQGSKNGVARIWVDGTKVLDVNDVQYFFPSQVPAFIGLSWNPTYGGGHNPVPYNMWHKIDHWMISGK